MKERTEVALESEFIDDLLHLAAYPAHFLQPQAVYLVRGHLGGGVRACAELVELLAVGKLRRAYAVAAGGEVGFLEVAAEAAVRGDDDFLDHRHGSPAQPLLLRAGDGLRHALECGIERAVCAVLD